MCQQVAPTDIDVKKGKKKRKKEKKHNSVCGDGYGQESWQTRQERIAVVEA